ncbi:unnamed protein product, partial [Rotaria sp. Silwood2]
YNGTLGHNENCGQIIDFDGIAGPLCSCPHRPHKCPHDDWSLKDAIVYTFQENLDNISFHLHKCQGVTKLAIVINEK